MPGSGDTATNMTQSLSLRSLSEKYPFDPGSLPLRVEFPLCFCMWTDRSNVSEKLCELKEVPGRINQRTDIEDMSCFCSLSFMVKI